MTEIEKNTKLLASKAKGILAADESLATIGKRFTNINVDNTEANRRAYRVLLTTTPNLANFICGVILFAETFRQHVSDELSIPDYLLQQGILPGIKLDLGLVDYSHNSTEKVTKGIDDLSDRVVEYKTLGAKFAKWRAVYQIADKLPSQEVMHLNAELLARYAKICQEQQIIPIVEPEVLMDGNHDIVTTAEVTEQALNKVFSALRRYKVSLEHMVLKPNMVVAGKDAMQPSPQQVATYTIKVLRRCVPAAVPSINFLSGGITPQQATEYLNAINQEPQPWNLSFSYGRALQVDCLKAWQGEKANIAQAQEVLLKIAEQNAHAAIGKYNR